MSQRTLQPLRFGEKLRALRSSRGMTLQQLALTLNLRAHGYLSELEAGKKVPTVALVLGLAEHFGVTTDQLLRDDLDIFTSSISHHQPMMSLAFIQRPPSTDEIEQLRLILSTFQDGSGMVKQGSKTLPGWRDFERTISTVFAGEAPENKAFFDVLLRNPENGNVRYGLSCKMCSKLNRVIRPNRDGRVTIEESNSAGEFKDELRIRGISESAYRTSPEAVGAALIDIIERRKQRASTQGAFTIDIQHSYYIILLWSRTGLYQLFQFKLDLPSASSLRWYYATSDSRHINGDDRSGGRVFEWYPDSGGQLKYYPHVTEAVWKSEPFVLEPLRDPKRYALAEKAAAYFPAAWRTTPEPDESSNRSSPL